MVMVKFYKFIFVGQNGHLASQAIKSFILDYYSNINLYGTLKVLKEDVIYEKLKENNYEKLKNSFVKAEKYISGLKFDVNFSGSTAVAVLVLGILFT